MRIPGKKKIIQTGQWIQSRYKRHALILGYHQVAEKANDVYGICVTPDHFQEQMEVLHRYAHSIHLKDLTNGIKGGQFPDHSVAVTFDDGYSDLLYTVKPILEAYRIPSTVFIVTGCIGQEFWWDELERLVSGNGFESDSSASSLYQQLLPLPLKDRQQVMSQIRGKAAHSHLEREQSRALTLDELVQLSAGQLMEIGSHGVNHLSLNQLTLEEQKSELLESKTYLEKHIGKPVYSFSYPNGSYSSDSPELVRESGYQYACRSTPAPVFNHNDLYLLPRFWIPDWDGQTFKQWLLRWL
jgi:peptidoglycan/xylan/chitin deacetylase (PgdA/CDA1 family)